MVDIKAMRKAEKFMQTDSSSRVGGIDFALLHDYCKLN